MTTPERPVDALAGSAVLARANALMQRRRPQNDDLPILTDALPESELPVLTTVLAEDEPDPVEALAPISTPTSTPAHTSAPAPTAADLAAQLSRHVSERLASELPSLIDTALQQALAGLATTLRHNLNETAEAALRDFLADATPAGDRRAEEDTPAS